MYEILPFETYINRLKGQFYFILELPKISHIVNDFDDKTIKEDHFDWQRRKFWNAYQVC